MAAEHGRNLLRSFLRDLFLIVGSSLDQETNESNFL